MKQRIRQVNYELVGRSLNDRVICGWAMSLVSITCVLAFLLLSGRVMADNTASPTASVTVSSACMMATTGDGTISATMIPGGDTEIMSSPITITCNDGSGYALYAIGYSGDSYSASSHTDLIYTPNSTYNIKTDGTSGASNWKMKLANLTNATAQNSYSAYQVIPANFVKVAQYGSSTTSGSLTPTYQVHASTTQVAGNYTGKVKYTLVHPNTMVAGTYTIAYNANGGSGTMDSTTNVYNFEEQTLPASTFTAPSGYQFAGWCTVQDSGTSPQTTCSGTSYTDEATLPASTVANNGTLALYAYWEVIPKTYMQDLTSTTIAALLPNKGDTATVYDRRDTEEQEYTIAKLEDGKYWMVTNLNLAGGTALSADDTDVTSAYIDNFTGSADMDTSPRLVKSGNTIVLPGSDTAGFNNDSNAYVYNSGTTTNCGASGQNTSCYSYYSWIAATLGGKQADGTTAETRSGYNAAASICPKGWRLPTSTTSNAFATTSPNWKTGDWYALASAYEANLENDYYESAATFYNNAGPGTTPNFLLAGYYGNGSFYDGGPSGYYWSATSYYGAGAYYLLFNSGSVYLAGSSVRRAGNSVRCVFGSA